MPPSSAGPKRRVAVLQSNYIPWKGYFHIIREVDEFIFYDDVQFTKNDWRNRNRIKTAQGVKWISIPVGSDLKRLICEVKLPDKGWAISHWDQIRSAYSNAPFFKHYRDFLKHVYLEREWATLSELNQFLIRHIAVEFLGLTHCRFGSSLDYTLSGARQDRLMALLEQSNAEIYVSGPAARAYLEPERFAAKGIDLQYMDYSKYPEYPQPHPPFAHDVSVLDLLFNVGPNAPHFIWTSSVDTLSIPG